MIQRRLFQSSHAIICRHGTRQNLPRSHIHPLQRIAPLSRQPFPRCYSTATETSSSGGAETQPPPESPVTEPKADDAFQKDTEAKSKEIIDLKASLHNTTNAFWDKYLRSVAEFRNLQDRTKRDIDTARNFAISRFASDLVESVDNLDRALGTVSEEKIAAKDNPDLLNLYEGLKMTDRILMQTLKKHGLERFDPTENGDKFNPNIHEATFQTKVEGKEDGDVFMTQQKGFLLNGRVVRAAKVGVVKNT